MGFSVKLSVGQQPLGLALGKRSQELTRNKRWGMDMEYIKEVLRLWYETDHNRYQIATALGISHPTVTRFIRIAESNGGMTMLELSDAQLKEIFYPVGPGRKEVLDKAEIDCVEASSELKRRGVTRQLLYEEYRDNNPGHAFSYSVFCNKLRDYENRQRLSMLLDHKPAEVLYLDYCGDTVPIYDRTSNRIAYEAEIFVATLAASGYSFFEGHLGQDSVSFVGGITMALSYIGGVVARLVPDNLKAGVITNNKSDLKLSRAMMELGAYYEVFVDPTRKYRAKDKAKVEERVGFIQRHALAALRNEKFYSLEELNGALAPLREAINQRPFTNKPGSRSELFEKEREFLRPLPLLPFSYGTWKTVSVPPNYHIEIAQCSYSVPNQLRNKKVEVRIGETVVEIFFEGTHVATHRRSHTPGEVVTLPAHLHPAHRNYLARLDRDGAIAEAAAIGPSTAEMAARVIDAARIGETGLKSVWRMLGLAKEYSRDDLEKACQYGLGIGANSRQSVASILKSRVHEAPPPSEPPSPAHEHLRSKGYFNNAEVS
jgi:transposase